MPAVIFKGKRAKALTQQGLELSSNAVIDHNGPINYIDNGHAELSTVGWAVYADGSATPVDGTGGSPTLAWARSTSSPLADDASFLLTPGALGNGASYDFTIDSAIQAQVVECSFYYQITTPASYTKGDITLWIYDVTNATLIQPSVFQLDNVIGPAQHRFEFQAASNSTSYRLLVHQATSTTGYASIKMDNFQLGPSKLVNGSIVTDWVSYTPSVLEGANNKDADFTSRTAFYKRNGTDLIIQAYLIGNANARSGTGNFIITIPSGLSIDTAKISNVDFLPGTLKVSSGTPNDSEFTLAINGTNQIRVVDTGTGYVAYNNATLNPSSGRLALEVTLPILGWGAQAVLGQDADTRVVALRATKSTGNHTSTGNYQDVTSYDVVDADTHGAFNSTTGVYTVQVAGLYQVTGTVGFVLNATGARGVLVQKNGVNNILGTLAAGNSVISSGLPFSGIIPCVAGDTLKVQAFQSSGGNLAYLSGNGTNLSIQRISGPAQVAASEIIAAKYNTSTTAIGTSATAVVFTNKIVDTHNAFNTSTGVFTCPAPGVYEISSCTTSNTAVSSSSANVLSTLYAQKNNTNDSLLGAHQYQVSSVNLVPVIMGSSTLISCLAGDTLRIAQTRNASISAYSLGGATDNWISIKRIGGIG